MSNTEGFTDPANKAPTDATAFDPAVESPATSGASGMELEPIEETAPPASTETTEVPPMKQPKPKVKGSLAGGTWVALIMGCLLLILLLVFILQNQQAAELNFFTWNFTFPAGVGFLLSSIAGALIMALVGGVRMLELRRQVKKEQKRH